MSKWKWGKRSKRMLFGDVTTGRKPINKIMQKHANLTLKYSTVDMQITDGYRTTKEQQKMFLEKHSELDGINDISDHQNGNAYDAIPIVRDPNTKKKLNPYDTKNIYVRNAWLELYRAQMRASMKLGIVIEFGFGYNIGNGRDWPHLSYKGKISKLKV